LFFNFVFPLFAAPPTSPYEPGETRSPICSPGDVNCTVSAPLTGPGTHGYIPFYSASSTILTSTSSLFWDVTNGWLGIGTSTPSALLDINGGAIIRGTATTSNLSIGSLSGLLKGSSGVIGVASAGVDYENALTFSTGLDRSSNTITNTGVRSLVGTINQIIASSATGTVTLSLPQDVATSSSPTFQALRDFSGWNTSVNQQGNFLFDQSGLGYSPSPGGYPTATSSWSAYDASNVGGLDTTGYWGTISDGRYVYYVPLTNGNILRYDTTSDFTNSSAWASYNASSTGGLTLMAFPFQMENFWVRRMET